MIEAVVFDVDGVLVHGGVFGARLSSELGLKRAALDSFWHGPFARCSLGLSDLKQEAQPFLDEWGYEGSVEHFLEAWFEADSALNAQLFDEVAHLRRRGIPCHVASNQERYRAAYLEGTMGLGARFDRLFFSCHLGVKKPATQFFQEVSSALRLAPAGLLFFDDQQANVDAARAAGWHAEIYLPGHDLRPTLARHGLGGPP
jgi:putative hydrolase of the HAD superfamily